jgi:hypothetical protein
VYTTRFAHQNVVGHRVTAEDAEAEPFDVAARGLGRRPVAGSLIYDASWLP